jgi:hypothetical protein
MFKNWGNNLPFITQNRNSCLWWGGVRLGHPGHQLKNSPPLQKSEIPLKNDACLYEISLPPSRI